MQSESAIALKNLLRSDPPNMKDSPNEWPVVRVPKCLSRGLYDSLLSLRMGQVKGVSSFYFFRGFSRSSEEELTEELLRFSDTCSINVSSLTAGWGKGKFWNDTCLDAGSLTEGGEFNTNELEPAC